MGIFRCNIHGLQGFDLVCAHVAEAIRTKVQTGALRVVEEPNQKITVCEKCLSEHNVQFVRESAHIFINSDLKFVETLDPYCSKCVENWFRHFGEEG